MIVFWTKCGKFPYFVTWDEPPYVR